MTNTEQPDLDAIESRAAWASSYSTDGVQAVAERFRIARYDVPALIARVRTAEAALAALADACPGCDGSGACPAPAHQHGCFADTEGHCNDPGEHGERTVETAEEWEYGIRMEDSGTEYWNVPDPRGHVKQWSETSLIRRRPPGKSEPVPPTPEEGDR
jgi:hypothetical protein